MTDDFGDALVDGTAQNLPDRFFDRFMFNLHPQDAVGPSLIVGAGVYPGTDVVDGFLVAVGGDRQRNLRFSTELSTATETRVGPFHWEVIEPLRRWRLVLSDNPAYPSWRGLERRSINIVGRVLWFGRALQ